MICLWSPQGLRALENLKARRPLLGFDFDGTLCPITSDPGAARMADSTLRFLDEISRRWPVMILSGRARADLLDRFPSLAVSLVGSHGLDDPGLEMGERMKAREQTALWKAQLHGLAGELAGVWIEDKELSLSIHYRLSPDPLVEERLLTTASKLRPIPRLIRGKKVLSLVPSGAPSKASGFLREWRRREADCGLFVGDDVTDEDVFSLRQPDLFTVRVRAHQDSAAQYYLDSQEEIDRLLRALLT